MDSHVIYHYVTWCQWAGLSNQHWLHCQASLGLFFSSSNVRNYTLPCQHSAPHAWAGFVNCRNLKDTKSIEHFVKDRANEQLAVGLHWTCVELLKLKVVNMTTLQAYYTTQGECLPRQVISIALILDPNWVGFLTSLPLTWFPCVNYRRGISQDWGGSLVCTHLQITGRQLWAEAGTWLACLSLGHGCKIREATGAAVDPCSQPAVDLPLQKDQQTHLLF